MKTIFLLIFVLVTLDVAAQNHLVGITGGPNRTNVISHNFINNTDHRIEITGGITYEYFLKKQFSIGAEIIFNQRGFTDEVEHPAGIKFTDRFDYDYLSLPVKIGFTDFNATEKVFGFAKLGLVPSLIVDAKTTTPAFDRVGNITGIETYYISDRVSKYDLAGLAEIGGGFTITGRLWLTTSFIYQQSFTSITNTEYFANSKIRHNGFALNVGLKWAVKNE